MPLSANALKTIEIAFEMSERAPTARHANALLELRPLESKAEPRVGRRENSGGAVRLKIHYRVASNRNHARRSASSIQISIRLVVAYSLALLVTTCAARKLSTKALLSA